ncbi:MAG TPA: transketolase C-terminal domain-containing protein, partial [Bacillota bacterium]|nr:transketolase C-terminal domain-containing protein [Bacillota bacterium]
HGVTMAAALAADGFKPVVAIYSTFMQRAYDQVLHDVCLQNLPVVLALDRAGLVGEDGPTHHGVFDLAYLRHIPNMMIMTPKDENELQQMLVTAVDYDGPCAIRYPRGEGKGVALDAAPAALPVGQGEVLRAGEDCTILAIGSMVNPALEAAELLAARGIQAAVVNCRFVKPLDAGLILSYAKPGSLVVTVEEHCLRGGFGSAVLELLEENRVTGVRMHCMGIPDEFAEHGKPEILKDQYKLNAKGICEQVEAECQKKPGIRTAKCED